MSDFAYTKDEVSKLAKYPFEPYMPGSKLKICITGAGGFIASHLAKRLKEEGHHIVACDWKRNEHMSVSSSTSKTRAPSSLKLPLSSVLLRRMFFVYFCLFSCWMEEIHKRASVLPFPTAFASLETDDFYLCDHRVRRRICFATSSIWST